MTPENRANRQRLLDQLHERRDSYEVQNVIALLKIELEQATQDLLDSPPEMLLAKQAVAKSYEQFLRLLTRPQAKITRPVANSGDYMRT